MAGQQYYPAIRTSTCSALSPGAGNGMELGGPAVIAATGTASDAITVVYADYAFPLNQYTATIPAANPLGDKVTFAPPAAPAGRLSSHPVSYRNSGGRSDPVHEQSGLARWAKSRASPPQRYQHRHQFRQRRPAEDQPDRCGHRKHQIHHRWWSTIGTRIWAVTYFIEVPAAATSQPPRLMRQVNGQKPVPVADNIINLKVTYDVCDGTNGPNCSGIPNPLAAPFSPSQIHKVNIQVMGQTLNSYGNKSRSTILTTSVSTRSLSFKDRYQLEIAT